MARSVVNGALGPAAQLAPSGAARTRRAPRRSGGSAKLMIADLTQSKRVIHVIDKLLLPRESAALFAPERGLPRAAFSRPPDAQATAAGADNKPRTDPAGPTGAIPAALTQGPR